MGLTDLAASPLGKILLITTAQGMLCESHAIYAEDLPLAGGVDYMAHIKMIGERAGGQKVLADRKAATAAQG